MQEQIAFKLSYRAIFPFEEKLTWQLGLGVGDLASDVDSKEKTKKNVKVSKKSGLDMTGKY